MGRESDVSGSSENERRALTYAKVKHYTCLQYVQWCRDGSCHTSGQGTAGGCLVGFELAVPERPGEMNLQVFIQRELNRRKRDL